MDARVEPAHGAELVTRNSADKAWCNAGISRARSQYSTAMQLKVTTWNINSVRLRIDLVAKFIKAIRPDVLCLQETKCPDDSFPLKRFRRLGYQHVAINGQKGYHGVAVLSRLPFDTTSAKGYCGKTDSRHVSAVLGERAGLRDPLTLHNYYVPAGGDEPDPDVNPKFAHKLSFLNEMRDCPNLRPGPGARAIVVPPPAPACRRPRRARQTE
jgi:exodeoxyribonuclease-3